MSNDNTRNLRSKVGGYCPPRELASFEIWSETLELGTQCTGITSIATRIFSSYCTNVRKDLKKGQSFWKITTTIIFYARKERQNRKHYSTTSCYPSVKMLWPQTCVEDVLGLKFKLSTYGCFKIVSFIGRWVLNKLNTAFVSYIYFVLISVCFRFSAWLIFVSSPIIRFQT